MAPFSSQFHVEQHRHGKSEGATCAEPAENNPGCVEIIHFRVRDNPAEGIDAVFDSRGIGVLGRKTVSHAYEGGACAGDGGRPAGIIGGAADCEAAAVEVKDDGKGFVGGGGLLGEAGVGCGEVEEEEDGAGGFGVGRWDKISEGRGRGGGGGEVDVTGGKEEGEEVVAAGF